MTDRRIDEPTDFILANDARPEAKINRINIVAHALRPIFRDLNFDYFRNQSIKQLQKAYKQSILY